MEYFVPCQRENKIILYNCNYAYFVEIFTILVYYAEHYIVNQQKPQIYHVSISEPTDFTNCATCYNGDIISEYYKISASISVHCVDERKIWRRERGMRHSPFQVTINVFSCSSGKILCNFSRRATKFLATLTSRQNLRTSVRLFSSSFRRYTLKLSLFIVALIAQQIPITLLW